MSAMRATVSKRVVVSRSASSPSRLEELTKSRAQRPGSSATTSKKVCPQPGWSRACRWPGPGGQGGEPRTVCALDARRRGRCPPSSRDAGTRSGAKLPQHRLPSPGRSSPPCARPAPPTTRPGSSTSAASTPSERALPTYAYSSSSKAALHQLTRHLVKELGPQHVTVNALAPRQSPSKIMAATLDAFADAIAGAAPLRRIGRRRYGRVSVFLTSRAGACITARSPRRRRHRHHRRRALILVVRPCLVRACRPGRR